MAASVEMVTVAEFEVYTGVAAGADTAKMTPILAAVSEGIERHLGVDVVLASAVEYHNPQGESKLKLRKRPVDRDTAPTIVESLDVPRDYTGTALTTSEYTVDHRAGIITRLGSWPNGDETVKVTYTAGWAATVADVPNDLKQAALTWASAIYWQSKDGMDGQKVRRLGPYTNEYMDSLMPARALELLGLFKDWAI